MKVTSEQEKKEFRPIELHVTIETLDELRFLKQAIGRTTGPIGWDLYNELRDRLKAEEKDEVRVW